MITSYSHFLLESIVNFGDDMWETLEKLSRNQDVDIKKIAMELIDIAGADIKLDSFKKDITISRSIGQMVKIQQTVKMQPVSSDIRFGRIIKQILPHISDDKIGKFVTEYTNILSYADKFNKISIVQGSDISKAYRSENTDCKSTIGQSCMLDSTNLEIYDKNPDQVRLLVYIENSKVHARALVWNLGDGEYLMDRIYYSTENLFGIFIKYAMDKGWYYKDAHNTLKLGESECKELIKVKLKNHDFDGYPYMDTFKYKVEDTLYTKIPGEGVSCEVLTDTLGGVSFRSNYTDVLNEFFTKKGNILNRFRTFNIRSVGENRYIIDNESWYVATQRMIKFRFRDIISREIIYGRFLNISEDMDFVKYIDIDKMKDKYSKGSIAFGYIDKLFFWLVQKKDTKLYEKYLRFLIDTYNKSNSKEIELDDQLMTDVRRSQNLRGSINIHNTTLNALYKIWISNNIDEIFQYFINPEFIKHMVHNRLIFFVDFFDYSKFTNDYISKFNIRKMFDAIMLDTGNRCKGNPTEFAYEGETYYICRV